MHAYSTDNPAAVEAFRTARAEAAAFSLKVKADTETLGNNKGALFRSGIFGGRECAGLMPDDPGSPPAGWVYSKTRDYLIPRRGRAGDDARAWLDAHTAPSDGLYALGDHGLPRGDALGETPMGYRMGGPVVFHLDGILWALYQGEPDGTFGGPPACTWTERKLSEYHAAREAFDAANETVAA